MLHRSYMRRGVSLEVIVEEDDNAEVSLDPHPLEEEEEEEYYEEVSTPSSPSSFLEREIVIQESQRSNQKENKNKENLILNNIERLREEKEKRRKKKEEEERWRNLGRQRSLSCETLTILDVGDDEFSQEQWEEEARDWDMEENSNCRQTKQCISRKEILESRIAAQNNPEYKDGNQERKKIYEQNLCNGHDNDGSWNSDGATEYEDILDPEGDIRENYTNSEFDCSSQHNEEVVDENDIQYPDKNENTSGVEKNIYFELNNGDEEINYDNDNSLENTSNKEDQSFSLQDSNSYKDTLKHSDLWLPDPFENQSDAWITVGELENGELEDKVENGIVEQESPPTPSQEPTTQRIKEVRFSDKLEILLDEKSSEEQETQKEENTVIRPSTAVLQDHLLDVKRGRDIFESRQLKRGKPTHFILPERLAAALENPEVLVVERSSPSPSPLSDLSFSSSSTSTSIDSKQASHCTHNMELHSEELPPPNTVASVRQLFEKLPVPVYKVPSFHIPTRFDHVRSNPTSKILRFDRDRHDRESSPSIPSSNSLTLPRLRKELTPISNRTPTRRASIALRPAEDFSSTGIYLRKPTVASGFNVKKALQENPRYFHIRVGDKSKRENKKKTESRVSERASTRSTITYSYLEAKHQQRSGATTSLRWTKETFDRSDAESMSSESSEDSGVSKDFSSSILSSFSTSSKNKKISNWPHNLSNEYASDPSFKWIDPQVLAKIRSVGTTVIYFGPRHRPQGRPNSGSLRRPLKWINHESNIMEEGNGSEKLAMETIKNIELEMTKENFQNFYLKSKSEKGNSTNGNANGPRIVGVVHKRNSPPYHNGVNGDVTNRNENKKKNTNGCNSNISPLLQANLRHRSDMENKQVRWNSPRDTSVVYDFTQPHSTS